MLGTGSPIPLWHIERLDHPVGEITAIGDEALELKDGSTVRLPFIKRLPRTDPLLAKAVSRGVEVGQGGVVYGLVEPTRMCGNDPVVYYRVRINLSELDGSYLPRWDQRRRSASGRDQRLQGAGLQQVSEISGPECRLVSQCR